MKEAIKISTVSQCNNLLHEKTRHPLISIIELNDDVRLPALQMELYAILLRHNTACCCNNGWRECDYCDATLIALSPEKFISTESSNILQTARGYLLLLHPLLLKGTDLEEQIKRYTFFRFRPDEALHLSMREYNILCTELENLRAELNWGIDEYSRTILVNRLTLLLDYCLRFYKRQFITRHEYNCELVARVEHITENYFLSAHPCRLKIPTIASIAHTLNLSDAYLEALLIHETGYCGMEFIQMKRIEIARKQLLQTTKSIHVIACELGFQSTQYFCHLFKKLTGYTPLEYRLQN